MRIGLLGTGNVARALATGWQAAGHDVVLGSRSPKERGDAEELGGFTVVGLGEAAAHGEVLVNATPGTESVGVLRGIGAAALAGKTLVDVGVGFTANMELSHPNYSLSEEIQAAFPETPVVKTLVTMDSVVMTNPGSLEETGMVFLSGDDAAAKRTTRQLLGDLGWPDAAQLDLGGIGTARGQEHAALLFIGVGDAIGTYGFGFKVVRPTIG
ncbi:NAD(P)-binding domain-containing protein [Streptomyces durmitorensis]|uniref:NAD(P)-binding domain-containing protein n=1 Tax=Streptomyces durmitorensis TaxID=319947 RepID=A0ABY4PXM3_9ACTN|nr:NAD(P)-binding domain-containing protein [Streptomyces durmitorensis]UQT57696.1 NAD(P)-binding domain-containing protein [Streptomyces durmitorensis]